MKPLTKRRYLRELVEAKSMAFPPLTEEERTLGFLGWHERGYLPHCDYPGLVQFVTFRLADSMPASRRGEWEHLLKSEDARERRTELESYLDRGVGECHLRDPRIAKLGDDALLFFHNERYELLAWVRDAESRPCPGSHLASAAREIAAKLEIVRSRGNEPDSSTHRSDVGAGVLGYFHAR